MAESKSYAAHLDAHRRLALLRALQDGYTANESLLADVVNGVGVRSTRDQVRTALAWLRDQGLATIRDFDGLMVATITEAGLDVAAGRTVVPGVKRPSPRGD